MVQPAPRRKVPIAHILMGMSGWAALLFIHSTIIVGVAIFLSLLAVPRFLRGPWEKADKRITHMLQEEAYPSRRVAHYLFPSEQLLWETHEHPVKLFWWGAGSALLLALSVVISIYTVWQVAVITAGVVIVGMGVKYFLLRHDRLCLTNRRLMAVRGFAHVQVGMMPIKKLTDESFKIPWHSRLLSWLRIIETEYGTIKVESAGQDQALSVIKFVPNVVQLNRIIMAEALA